MKEKEKVVDSPKPDQPDGSTSIFLPASSKNATDLMDSDEPSTFRESIFWPFSKGWSSIFSISAPIAFPFAPSVSPVSPRSMSFVLPAVT